MAVISDMSQPLGEAIGNTIEIKESIETLIREERDELTELCLTLVRQMAVLGGEIDTIEEARKQLKESISSGKALEYFKTMIESQGGNSEVVDSPEQLPQSKYQIDLPALSSVYVSNMVADDIGVAASMLGAERTTKDSVIDLAVGVVLHKKVGDKVEKNESLLTIYSNNQDIQTVKDKLYSSIQISEKVVASPTLIY